MRAAIVIEGLRAGGAERFSCFLAEGLAGRGADVSFVTVNAAESSFYCPPEDCRLVDLGLDRGKMPLLEKHLFFHSDLYRKLKESLLKRRPDIVVSLGTKLGVMTLKALEGSGIPAIVSERGDPEKGRIEWIYRALRKALYPQARAVVCLTSFAAGYYAKKLPGIKTVVIPNPLFPHFGRILSEPRNPPENPGRPFILSVGRLSKQKNYPLLLDAFASLASRHPGWDLVIHGEGKQEADLKLLAKRLGLKDRIRWPGVTLDLGPVYEAAGIYVQSSLYEGFCNTLLEALSHGKPVVATRWGGVEDLVSDGKNGLLAPMEPVGLAKAIDRLLSDPELRVKLGERARESRDRFTPKKVLDDWIALLNEVCGSAR